MNEQLSVQLGLDIVYVNGLVNGEVADFQLTGEGVWSATVPSNDEGRYEIEINAYNTLGTMSTYSTVIYFWDGLILPITNWTSSDHYNAADLVRVEANTQYVADTMITAGYHPALAEFKLDWTKTDIPFISDINRIERNILALAQVLRMQMYPDGWEDPVTNWASGMGFDYQDANRLEKNIALLYDLVIRAIANFKYTGTFACGEEGDIY